MLRTMILLLPIAMVVDPAVAQQSQKLEHALDGAMAAFEMARPHLGDTLLGVDTQAYGAALSLLPLTSPYWDTTLQPHLVQRPTATGTCRRYIAYTRRPDPGGTIALVLCPLFFAQPSDHLRVLTLLHEMVHVVAGPDECRAMAYAARIEWLAYGKFTANRVYWSASGCQNSPFDMPR